MKRSQLIAVILSSAIVAILHVFDIYHVVAIHPTALAIVRWALIAFILFLAWKKRTVTAFIIAFLFAGAEFGYDFPQAGMQMKLLSDIFLRLIKTIIAPLLFSTLVIGIATQTNLKQLGRLGWKSLIYFEVFTLPAIFIGLAAINISQAGVGIVLTPEEHSLSELNVQKQTATDVILRIFPENIAKSIAEGQVLQIVVFSILFGLGLAFVKDEKKKGAVLGFIEGLSALMFQFTSIVMYFAPFAVFGAVSYAISKYGIEVFGNLAQLLLTLYVALIAFLLLGLFPIMLIARIPVKKFLHAVSEPFTLAFATASSESALPIAMEKMEKLGVSKKIVSFVLPTGYSFNLDGTTLYLAVASIFVAQAGGIHLSFGEQLVMMLTLILTSKGVAGVPRASLVILAATVASFGLPSAPILLILGIDAFLDMARTSVNVFGNCLASAVIARWEGEFDDKATT